MSSRAGLSKYSPATRIPDQTCADKLGEYIRTLLHDPKPEVKLHAANLIRHTSEVPEERLRMLKTPLFIEALSFVLRYGTPCSATRRVQHHALKTLTNVLLTDPTWDAFLAADDNLVPSLHSLLLVEGSAIQPLAAQVIDYLAVCPDNQTLLCTYPELLGVIVRALHTAKETETRTHLLQALLSFSSHPKNWFLMARQRDILTVVSEPLLAWKTDEQGCYLSLSILLNLISLRENVAIFAASTLLHDRLLDAAQSDDADNANTAAFILQVVAAYHARAAELVVAASPAVHGSSTDTDSRAGSLESGAM